MSFSLFALSSTLSFQLLKALINDVKRFFSVRFCSFAYMTFSFSQTLSEHKVDVRCVLQQLLENCLYVKAENVNFMLPQSLSWVLGFQGDR